MTNTSKPVRKGFTTVPCHRRGEVEVHVETMRTVANMLANDGQLDAAQFVEDLYSTVDMEIASAINYHIARCTACWKHNGNCATAKRILLGMVTVDQTKGSV